MRTGLIVLGALLALVQATNAAELALRPRPVLKPATENRTAPPQQRMLLEEIFRSLRPPR